ncbi:MAG: UDP-N-acetylmuramoyl-tripeptide--D-alanyl-D-alanine ligase [Sphingobacteriales bacterium]|nr:UDP-N-acetylmuramoyl-tripeptide--D-alanyl-D-alanine ligase [Sphingobacteriales bacterium]
MDIQQLYEFCKSSTGITTDSRNIEKGQLYFALKGENFNGNLFAVQALEAGASYAIIDEATYPINERCIVVANVLDTLQQLALLHRIKTNPKAVIAITGSNGKTTTKELVATVLSTTHRTHFTKGNLNNHIGIPLTLLAMPADTEIAVIEMGANHQKEIERYCKYAEPTHGIITNCGKAHLEGFGGMEGIRKGKGELYDYMYCHQGKVFVNGDDITLINMLQERTISGYISYGNNEMNTYNSKILADNPFLKIQFEDIEINSHLFGSYNYSNIMCAIAVGKYFDIENQKIKQAIENYSPTNARSQVIEKEGYQLILDAYNANPTSMQHALESFAKSSVKKKIVILGDMFELGQEAPKEHQFIADLCEKLQLDTIVLVGNDFSNTRTSDHVLKFPTASEAQNWFRKQDFSDAEILLKGSRGMKMEKVLE